MPEFARMYADRGMRALLQDVGGLAHLHVRSYFVERSTVPIAERRESQRSSSPTSASATAAATTHLTLVTDRAFRLKIDGGDTSDGSRTHPLVSCTGNCPDK